MLFPRRSFCVAVITAMAALVAASSSAVEGSPRRILWDSDIDTDDFFGFLYLMKLNRSEFELQAITISANAWTNAGHAVNQVYDLLYMMGRDDIAVGVGGEGGILENGSILPNVGGYLPVIDQGMSTGGSCRYRQAIPVGAGGRLDIDANYGLRKAFLPQGKRGYNPLQQPTAQQVLIEKISEGPITVFMTGTHTNLGIFLMSNPHLKKNIEHIYIMGGGVRSSNPTGCCPKNSSSSCVPQQCGDRGNIFTDYHANPYAEFNIFGDPFAAYQVIHSRIPITLVPLDATNTIPINEAFFDEFEKSQDTYEAQYCFQSLKMARDTWFDDHFYTSYFMWDSFMSGIAVSIMRNSQNHDGENEFAEMEYVNITVITSNKPYGINDGSNPNFDGKKAPKFNLKIGGIHSGHVQRGLRDPLCFVKNGKGKCMDGYTVEANSSDSVRVLLATKAKPNQDAGSPLDREYFISFLNVLKRKQNSGLFNFTSQFPYYKEVTFKPDVQHRRPGKPVVFDMDLSAGDFLSLFYLLKVPYEVIDLKAIIVSPNGWANAATVDVVYDLLHMMGRDDIPVGLGDVFATDSNPFTSDVDGCKYSEAIPHGSGGFLDSDTLYGLARNLPRSPRRYTAENSVKFGAPRDTEHPELRQPLAMEVWESIVPTIKQGSKITVLTNGPLTNLAKVVSDKNLSCHIQEVYIVGGHISENDNDKGNLFSVASNQYAEFNMFLDPLAAKTVFESGVNITLIPLGIQREASSSFSTMLRWLRATEETPEAVFAKRLLSRLYRLKQTHQRYQHMDTFLGEILGAIASADGHSSVDAKTEVKPLRVKAGGSKSSDGTIVVDEEQGKPVQILKYVDAERYYKLYSQRLGDKNQTAKLGSFNEQTRKWRHP
ncbi:hypothetical protein QN277_027380 [Acacia crassicarpa]|nr:hypothetical protein QN277_027380 [Acacia crassicarpa]